MYKREFAGKSPLGRDRFEDVIDKYGLKLRRKTRKPTTTNSSRGLPTYPTLIKDFIPTAPNQLWVSDITYIPIIHGTGNYRFCYLTIIMDGYSEEIKGYRVGNTLETKHSIMALEMALKSLEGQNKEDLHIIHHSDRGLQYAGSKYTNLLKTNNISISMTENGDPKENPQAERINSTIKNEIFSGRDFHSLRGAPRRVNQGCRLLQQRETAHEYWYDDARGSFNIYRG